ncbi:hypothetical protein SHAb15599_00165 [Acinetobacter phage SH-Ab 15599]|nr:hypothetical protein SHAb15599_00165 [Acinetobacter phage SH-Ab 15599]
MKRVTYFDFINHLRGKSYINEPDDKQSNRVNIIDSETRDVIGFIVSPNGNRTDSRYYLNGSNES